jgi:hypothetical protein
MEFKPLATATAPWSGVLGESNIEVFYEVLPGGELAGVLRELVRSGARAKVRAGGVTEEAFPEPGALARFLQACATAGVAFKATAGLHHAMRGEYALTYEQQSGTAAMYGFMNLLFAAAFARLGWKAEGLIRVLTDPAAPSIKLEEGGWSWRGNYLPTEQVQAMRSEFMLSFGSCSFEEPMAEMQTLGWLTA